MSTLNKVIDSAKQLKEEFKTLDEANAILAACEIAKIDAIRNAFGVTDSDKYPTFLESLAISFGGKQDNISSVPQALEDIADALKGNY